MDLQLSPTEEDALNELAVNWHMTAQGAVRAIVLAKLYESMESSAMGQIQRAVTANDDSLDFAKEVRRRKSANSMREKGWLEKDDADRLPVPDPVDPQP